MRSAALVLFLVSSIAACGRGKVSATTSGAGTGGSISCGPGTVQVGNECVLATDAGDAGDAGPACTCAPPSPGPSWLGASLTWIADPQQTVTCPPGFEQDFGPQLFDLGPTGSCAPCTCSAPAGFCSPPATMTANAASCAQDGPSTAHTPFDPASGWTGGCDESEYIPPGKLCGGVECVQSLTIAPATLNETGCTPSVATFTPAMPRGGIYQCVQNIHNTVTCPDGSGRSCLPDAPGFQVCITGLGDLDCADAGAYTEKHVAYGDLIDPMGCTPCTCGPPSGSTCSTTVSVYTENGCTVLAYSMTIDASGPACHDLPPGVGLGSKSATPPSYVPGTCAPDGGVLFGSPPSEALPMTWCCVPKQ
jgi:hypothetical protein